METKQNLPVVTPIRANLALRTGVPQEPLLPNQLAGFHESSLSWEIAV
jgi:hypothetical protein